MADDDDGAGKLSDDFFKLFYRSYIQMVRRFIQKQDIRLSNQCSGQRAFLSSPPDAVFGLISLFMSSCPANISARYAWLSFVSASQPRQNDVLKRFVF